MKDNGKKQLFYYFTDILLTDDGPNPETSTQSSAVYQQVYILFYFLTFVYI